MIENRNADNEMVYVKSKYHTNAQCANLAWIIFIYIRIIWGSQAITFQNFKDKGQPNAHADHNVLPYKLEPASLYSKASLSLRPYTACIAYMGTKENPIA